MMMSMTIESGCSNDDDDDYGSLWAAEVTPMRNFEEGRRTQLLPWRHDEKHAVNQKRRSDIKALKLSRHKKDQEIRH